MLAPELAFASSLPARLVQFGRLLRGAGLPVSSQQIVDLAQALTLIDLARADDFYFTLRSFLVHSAGERALFDRLFELFWLGQTGLPAETSERRSSSQLLSPWRNERQPADHGEPDGDDGPAGEEQDPLAVSAYSPAERLRRKEFHDYDEDDAAAARAVLLNLLWRMETRRTRRRIRSNKRGAELDLPRSIQRNMRRGGEIVELSWQRRQRKPRPLVVLCDISGSMERYSRLFLFLMFGLVRERARVEVFVFGTRLTRITPALRQADLDTAMRRAGGLVLDWSGGTRIGEALKAFNSQWARRGVGRGAAALIISDGWDRGDQELLDKEIRRLRRGVHRLIWLNPLAGSPSWQPLVRGLQTVLPHVDEMLPLHNLESVATLAGRLGAVGLGAHSGGVDSRRWVYCEGEPSP